MDKMDEQKTESIREPERVVYADEGEFMKAIPVEGSLGILAYGARGLLAWRKKRNQWLQTRNQEN